MSQTRKQMIFSNADCIRPDQNMRGHVTSHATDFTLSNLCIESAANVNLAVKTDHKPAFFDRHDECMNNYSRI